jgi:hypothetical protein
MSAMDFQRHFVPGSKEPFRRIVSYVSCIFISKSWLVWTHHLIVIINEKVNGKSPLSRATDSLLINLRSFPPSPLFVFFFYKKRNVLGPCFSLLFPPTTPSHQKKLRTGLVWITVDIPGRLWNVVVEKKKIPVVRICTSDFRNAVEDTSSSSNFQRRSRRRVTLRALRTEQEFFVRSFFFNKKKKVKRCSVLQQLILRCRSLKNGRKYQTPVRTDRGMFTDGGRPRVASKTSGWRRLVLR